MTPFRFGSATRELYGVLHMPPMDRFRGRSVLLCNPLGQEAVRVHRLYRVLAERLAKEGCSTLRFDYYGTGESAGDDTESSFAGWQADILQADAELRSRTGAPASTWMGARLGASAAALATVSATVRPDALVLWEPIADGAAYAREVALEVEGPGEGDAGMAGSTPSSRGWLDVQGFRATRAFMDEVAAVGRDAVWDARAGRIALLTAGAREQRWRDVPVRDSAMGTRLESEDDLDPFDWYAEEAMDTEVVPRKVVEGLMRRMLE